MTNDMLPGPRPASRRRVTALLTTTLAAALSLAACSGSGASTGADMAEAPAGGVGADGSAGEPVPGFAEGGTDSGSSDGIVAGDSDELMIVTGYVTVVVTDPIATATQVAGLVESQGGRISARSQQAAGERRTAFAVLTARIPADRVSSVLDQLTDYGAVRESQLESTEVTAQVRDLDARIEAMQISVDRLEDLLSRSGDLEDIVRVEQVLTDRQASLEQLLTERASLTDRVALSTVTINLLTEEAVPDEPPTGFLTGLASGWKALVSFLTALVSTVGVLLPWLGLAAVVTLVVWPLARRARRRSAARRPGGPSATLPVPGPVPGPPPAPTGPQPTAPDRD